MDQFVYPAILTPDVQDGGFVVTFVDVPEAITQGDTSRRHYSKRRIVLTKPL